MSKDLKAGDVVNVRGKVKYINRDSSYEVEFRTIDGDPEVADFLDPSIVSKIPRPPFIPGQIWEGADGERFLIVDTGGIELRYRRSGDTHGSVSYMEREYGPVTLVLDVV